MPTQICVFNPTTNLIDITNGVSVYTGSPANAGAPVVLNASGALDASFLNANPLTATAAVDLPAGSLVNLYYGTTGSPPVSAIYAQLATAVVDASPVQPGLPAMGFVSTDYHAGDSAIISTQGLVSVPFITGFSPADIGQPVYLSDTTPGGVTKNIPSNPDLIQPLGYIYQVFGSSNSQVQFPFLSFPLATVNQTPVATSSTFGVVKPDNTSITISGGIISATATSIATTGTVGVVKPDGTTITVNGSGLIAVPTATTSVLGLVKADGTTVTVSSGILSVPTATSSVLGLVKPDGTTILDTAGAISVPTGTTSTLGLLKADGTTITVTGGTITAATATNSTKGIVQPDTTTITISGGSITAVTATSSTKGIVKPDNTTITVSSGIITATGFLPIGGGTLTGSITVDGTITLQGAAAGSVVFADGSGSAVLSSANLSDYNSLVRGDGTVGYIAMYSTADSPPLSPPTLTNTIGDSHLDDGLTTPGVITSTEPIFVQGGVTAAYLAPFIIYSAAGTPLPVASLAYAGVQAVVSDATAPTYMGAYTSGGTVTCAVICSIDTGASPPVYAWLTH